MSTTINTEVQGGILTIDQAAAYLSIPKATLCTWRTRRPGSARAPSSSGAACATGASTSMPGWPSTLRHTTTSQPFRSSG